MHDLASYISGLVGVPGKREIRISACNRPGDTRCSFGRGSRKAGEIEK
jgi:hypothetical protein